MRRVDRKTVDAPTSLLAGGAGPAELESLRTFRKTAVRAKVTGVKVKSFAYLAYKGDDVKWALNSLFHGKCAYCETHYATSMPVDVEHYRPKGGVAEDAVHGGYWWISGDWNNLLPSCADCNRKRGQVLVERTDSLEVLAANAKPIILQAGKKNSFPLAVTGARAAAETVDFTAEKPLLLDPSRDDPSLSLQYNFDQAHPLGLLMPRGDDEQRLRGATSIQIYGLNRLRLVQDRTHCSVSLSFLANLSLNFPQTYRL